MRVLFCLPLISPGHTHRFAEEAEALEALGVEYDVISIEAVADGAWDLVLCNLPEHGARYLFRGLMLSGEEYQELSDELESVGHTLITSPQEYERSHYLPEYFPLIEPFTAPTTWIEGTNMNEAWEAAQRLGSVDRMVKDHVKSAKEQWLRSAFIPANCDRARFEAVCQGLIDYREERFERGLVFRALIPLRRLPANAIEMPLYEEHRLFFWKGALLGAWPYHDAPGYGALGDLSLWRSIAEAHDVPFFALDIARRSDGEWTVLEFNDGGVCGLPDTVSAMTFFERLLEHCNE